MALSPLVCTDAPTMGPSCAEWPEGLSGAKNLDSWVLSPHWPDFFPRKERHLGGEWVAGLPLLLGAPEGQGTCLSAVQPSPHDGLTAPSPLMAGGSLEEGLGVPRFPGG